MGNRPPRAREVGDTHDMTSQFDEIAKAVARGVSRRRALRGLLGGIAGAVVASLMWGSKALPAEAGTPDTSSAAVQAQPTWNQRRPGLNQTTFNQNRFNQNRFNQAKFNQAKFNAIRAKFNQNRAKFNQRRRFNQGAHWNSTRPKFNQRPLTVNQRGGPTLNMVHGPNFNRPTRP